MSLVWSAPSRARVNLLRLMLHPAIRLRLSLAGVSCGPGCRFYGFPIVNRRGGSTIHIGSEVEMRSSKNSNVLGVGHPVILTTMARGSSITIGDGVAMSGASVCAATKIIIGERTLLGVDVLITDSDHHQLSGERKRWSLDGVKSSPIHIGTDVFVGARSIVLKGASIGNGAVIGAGSVVSGTVEAGAIVVGNPARRIGWASGSEPLSARRSART